MPVYNGTNEIESVKLGSTQIEEIYCGTDEVWSNYKEILLGDVTIYATGDYGYNYFSNAKAYLIKDKKKRYLKITGKWYSKGTAVSANTQQFPTNINVGAQTQTVTVHCNCFYNTTSDQGSRYNVYDGHVAMDGLLYLPIAHEGVYRTFNQYDYDGALIELKPA